MQTAIASIQFLDIEAKLEVLPSWKVCIYQLFIKTQVSCQIPSTGCMCICAQMMKTTIVSVHWNLVAWQHCCYRKGILVTPVHTWNSYWLMLSYFDKMQKSRQKALVYALLSAHYDVVTVKWGENANCSDKLPNCMSTDSVFYLFSAPMTAVVLAKENSIKDWRELMGPTKSYRY